MERKEGDTPLLDALLKHADEEYIRYHVPGHKGGRFFNNHALELFRSILRIDLTELEGLDYLHAPQGIIKEAEERAAQQFHSNRTYFLINGSSVGNLAMVLGCISKGELVLVQRNSHQSVFNALSLAEAQMVPLTPQVSSMFQVGEGVDPEHFKEVLKRYPEAKACILTYPSYYGKAEPDQLQRIIRQAKQHGLLVLVDEAHGAHFGHDEHLPPSAMQLGADISVQSTHKMLGSLTMTAMLHINATRVPVNDVERYLALLQSSSPSYPLMASLDAARAQVSHMTSVDWQESIAGTVELRKKIAALDAYHISHGHPPEEDPYKLVIKARWGLSGFQLRDALKAYRIDVELADHGQVCLTLPLNPTPDWDKQLVTALKEIAAQETSEVGGRGSTREPGFRLDNVYRFDHPTPISLQVYRSHLQKKVPLSGALNRRAASLVTPYPPGIPILFPGEIITEEHVNQLRHLIQSGTFFQEEELSQGMIAVLDDGED